MASEEENPTDERSFPGMFGRMHDAVARSITKGAARLQGASAPALIGMLSASALTPIITTMTGAEALVVAGAGVAGNVGANVAADLLVAAAKRTRQRRPGSDSDPAAVEQELAEWIEAVITSPTAADQRLRADIAALFRSADIPSAAIRGAVDAGDEDLALVLAGTLIEIPALFVEFSDNLSDIRLAVESLQHEMRIASARYSVDRERTRHVEADLGRILDQLHRIRTQVGPTTGATGTPRVGWQGCPYLGLAAFHERDAAIFHGRRELTRRLVARLGESIDKPGVLLMLGASGAGKSSLLRAGLMAAIGNDGLGPGSRGWPRMIMTPSADPIGQLAAHLAGLLGITANGVRDSLIRGPEEVSLLLRQILISTTQDSAHLQRLVLVVDQFEELFTLGEPDGEPERELFVDILSTMAETAIHPDGSPGALVVVSLRGDFVSRATRFSSLRDAIEAGPLPVGPMTESAMREAIVAPAGEAGVEMPDEVATTILNDLRNRAVPGGFDEGSLPLLSQVMFEIWHARPTPELSLATYREVGGVSDIVQVSAERVFARLTAAQQTAVRIVFVHLSAETDGALNRRSSTHDALHAAVGDSHDADAVIDSFAAARLLTLAGDRVDIAHEELLRSWIRLRDWLVPDATDRALHHDLVEDTQSWNDNARDASYLYRGGRLVAVNDALTRWAARPQFSLEVSPDCQEFLRTSAHRDRRRRRAVRAAGATMAILLVLAGAAAVVANRQAVDARRQHAVALSRQLATLSQIDRTIPRTTAAQLAATALRLAPDDRLANEAAGQYLDHYLGILPLRAPADALAFTPDGHAMVAAETDGSFQQWDLNTGRPVKSAKLISSRLAPGDVLSSDGRILLRRSALDDNGSSPIVVWRLDAQRGATVITPHPVGSDAFDQGALSANGRWLVTSDLADHVRFWDLTTSKQVGDFSTGEMLVADLQISPDGSLVAFTTGQGSGVRVATRSATPRRFVRLKGAGDPSGMAFSRDGRSLALVGDASVALWDTRTGRPIGRPIAIEPHTGGVIGFSPNGNAVAAASGNGVVLHNMTDGTSHRFALPDGSDGRPIALAFSPDGRRLATAAADGLVRLWDIRSGRLVDDGRSVPAGLAVHSSDLRVYVSDEAGKTKRAYDTTTGTPIGPKLDATVGASDETISPDGRMFAESGEDDSVRVFDLKTGRTIGRLHGDPFPFSGITFRPHSNQLAVVDSVNVQVRLWDFRRNRYLPEVLKPPKGAWRLAFTADGRWLAMSNDGNLGDAQTFHIYNMETGKPSAHTFTMGGDLTDIQFSPDGRLVAAADDNATVRVWNRESGAMIGEVGSAFTTIFFAFSRDGRMLATAGVDKRIRLWPLDHFRQLGASINLAAFPVGLAFGPGDDDLTTISDASTKADGSATSTRVWHLKPYRHPLAFLCAQVGPLPDRDSRRLATGEDLPDACH